ncbi:cysteine-rich CWC family protein [Flexithrix dorotheae]|uniref:cysteine-rich CWC family protein n=1 Tax=Flexithrix dorotheae TaxID=70993 RepID=UPI00038234B8|nr:cysteine-rich CWC family protein [Flexithrix dorotheae]
MYKHEVKNCPRCDKPFECKVGSISICQCISARLNEAQRDYIRGKYNDCLCINCLLELKAEYQNQLQEDKLKSFLRIDPEK